MLEVCNITKIYKSFFKTKVACKNVSFEVREGEIASLLGLNGAGKSTILKIISGVLEATEGDVIIEGKSRGRLASCMKMLRYTATLP